MIRSTIFITMPRDDEDTRERSRTAIQECDNLMERCSSEVAVEDGRTDDSGEVEHHELCGHNDLGGYC